LFRVTLIPSEDVLLCCLCVYRAPSVYQTPIKGSSTEVHPFFLSGHCSPKSASECAATHLYGSPALSSMTHKTVLPHPARCVCATHA